jgi:hypothetical protein
MLPILATIGSGLAWFAATAGQLIFWGAGISVGFWLAKKMTNTWDQYGVNLLARRIYKKEFVEDMQAA